MLGLRGGGVEGREQRQLRHGAYLSGADRVRAAAADDSRRESPPPLVECIPRPTFLWGRRR